MFTSAAKNGFLIGLIGVGVIMIQYLTNSLIEQGIFQFLSPALYIALLFYFATWVRKELGGFVSYWNSWKILSVQALLSCLIYIWFNYALINIIDADLGREMNRFVKEKATEQIETYAKTLDNEAKEKILESITEKDYTSFSTFSINLAFLLGFVLVLNFGLAAFLRKNDPNAYLNA